MNQIIVIIITALITAIIVLIVKDLMFKCFIEDRSNRSVGTVIWGKTYFFMTQDQIQNACKSIIKSFPGILRMASKNENLHSTIVMNPKKPEYTCGACKKQFSSGSNLANHLKKCKLAGMGRTMLDDALAEGK